VPTVGELRVRREVEVANRRIMGFWGTVLGIRRVGKVGILPGDGAGGGIKGGDDVVEDPGAAKAKSVASADDGPGGSKADSAKDAVEDHAGAGAESVREAAKDPAEAKAESAKSVVEDNAVEEGEGNIEPDRASHLTI
jgi:hypothetical protein